MPSASKTRRKGKSRSPKHPLASAGTQRTYRSPHLLQIAMPLGGIGAGCVCLNGIGGLQDFSIYNRPATTAVPDGPACDISAFAALHIKGRKTVTKLIEGLMPPERIYDQSLQAQGYRKGGHEGLPRFDHCAFAGEYPFGHVLLTDPDLPVAVRITGWNPFIPLDDKNSGIPAAILEYTFHNTSRQRVDFEFSYHLSHLAVGKTTGEKGSRTEVIPNLGVFYSSTEPSQAESFGSAALIALAAEPKNISVKAMWLRGSAWSYEGISALWREVSEGRFSANPGTGGAAMEGRNGGSILIRGSLKPGESSTIPLAITWHFPNVNQAYSESKKLEVAQPACDPATGCCDPANPPPRWRPFYAGQWKDARDVALYLVNHHAELKKRTLAFKNALFSSTLPPVVIDAVSANLGILKSPTVLRQENGNVWAWEGCFTNSGCCDGSCTHVWNYAQAMPHLFPKLERTLREQELIRSINDEGHVTFRSALPDGPADHGYHAASDGQLGGIMKAWRDYLICGEKPWLESLYPQIKKSIDYCIQKWDPDRRGALFEPHHNTYDIEFWGPDGMCTSIYAGALSAMAAIERELGHEAQAEPYAALAMKAGKFLDHSLFNGEYYFQKVMYKELHDQSFVQKIAGVSKNSPENLQLLKREGPKFQYATGCISDGVIGAWMAKIYGIDSPQNQARVKKNLQSIFKYNFRADLSRHANTQRPGYAMGHEGGLILCTWPRGNKPTLPFIYSDEVWTGIEYQVASHMFEMGLLKEGLAIVEAARARYDGLARNPWNEYECGSYYARAMSSFALLNSLSGFRYDAAHKTLHVFPKIKSPAAQRFFFSAASGFGTIALHGKTLTIQMCEGRLAVEKVILKGHEHHVAGTAQPDAPLVLSI